MALRPYKDEILKSNDSGYEIWKKTGTGYELVQSVARDPNRSREDRPCSLVFVPNPDDDRWQ